MNKYKLAQRTIGESDWILIEEVWEHEIFPTLEKHLEDNFNLQCRYDECGDMEIYKNEKLLEVISVLGLPYIYFCFDDCEIYVVEEIEFVFNIQNGDKDSPVLSGKDTLKIKFYKVFFEDYEIGDLKKLYEGIKSKISTLPKAEKQIFIVDIKEEERYNQAKITINTYSKEGNKYWISRDFACGKSSDLFSANTNSFEENFNLVIRYMIEDCKAYREFLNTL